jgi:hypothetical protein
MVVHGRVKNGRIELDGGVSLPERASVEISVRGASTSGADHAARSLYDRLKPFIGAVKDLPADMSVNHDHYLYGTPKRS